MRQLKVSEISTLNAVAPSLIGKLLASLDAHEVRYCHWKSNWRISRWLDGEGDLDLLVRREDIGKFLSVLDDLGFKKAIGDPEMELPGVVNFYGYDPNVGKFIHIHAHFQLVFGHDLTKNYRLPIEEAYIREAVRRGEISIASPEMELILFIVRMVLKYSLFETAAQKFTGKLRAHRQAIKDEITYLERRIDRLTLEKFLQNNFPMIRKELLDECLSVLKSGSSFLQALRTKWKLETSLSAYSRMSRPIETVRRIQRRLRSLMRKFVLRQPTRKRLEIGGALIAIVGGDGAGKSTCVNAVSGWLSGKFVTQSVHLGKPPKSLFTVIVAAILRVVRLFGPRRSASSSNVENTRGNVGVGFLQGLRTLGIARDRFRLYKSIRRFAAGGGIVVCDRYPIPNLRLMDGPKIDPSGHAGLRGALMRCISDLEKSYYEKIMPPDLLFALRVPPAVAVARKTDEAYQHVFSRSTELWNFSWKDNRAKVIDAGRPLDEVTADLRQSIWQLL